MIRRTNQGGSVANFIVIGVILLVGLISAVYLLNQRGQQARKEQTIASSSNTQVSKPKTASNKVNKATANTPKKTTGQSKAQSQAAKMPATGVELSMVELAGAYLLTASTAAYILSRRPLGRTD
jgi:uncharacterized iron-regulated membrane protein